MYEQSMINPAPTALEQKEVPLSAILDKAFCCAEDCLVLAKNINRHLFSCDGEANKDARPEPQCFRDMLKIHNQQLMEIHDELVRISMQLGV